jgi:hypothetical protein
LCPFHRLSAVYHSLALFRLIQALFRSLGLGLLSHLLLTAQLPLTDAFIFLPLLPAPQLVLVTQLLLAYAIIYLQLLLASPLFVAVVALLANAFLFLPVLIAS